MEKKIFSFQIVYSFVIDSKLVERLVFVGETPDNVLDLLPFLDDTAHFHLKNFSYEEKCICTLESFNYSLKTEENGSKEISPKG